MYKPYFKTKKEEIGFDIAMTLYAEFNDTFCSMYEHLGDIYSYKDIEDLKKREKAREEELRRQFASELLEE